MQYILKNTKLAIKVIISVLFFIVLFSFIRGNELLVVFKNVHYGWFLLSFIITIIMVVVSCAKWKLALNLKFDNISFFELFKIYLIGYFFSNILPSTFGGDVARLYYAGKIFENRSFAAISVFIERLSGAFCLLVLTFLSPFLRPDLYRKPLVYLPSIFAFILFCLIIFLFKKPIILELSNKIVKNSFKYISSILSRSTSTILQKLILNIKNIHNAIWVRLIKLKAEMDHAVIAAKNDGKFTKRIIGLTLLFYVLTWINVYASFRAFHVEVDFVAICVLVPVIMFVAQVPVSILGNLGYFESVFVVYFLLVGVGSAETLAMGLLLRLKMLTLGCMGIWVYLSYRQKYNFIMDASDTPVENE